MPFLRLSRDRRGYETTFLLHTPHPGGRAHVLYWYRTAPGVRVGRPALDEDAIRTIEEQHPDIDFNWSEILAVGAALAMDVEPPPPPRRRGKPREAREPREPREARESREPREPRQPRHESPRPSVAASDEAVPLDALDNDTDTDMDSDTVELMEAEAPPRGHDLLEELVGREIATRLHARYAELSARISEIATDEMSRDSWRAKAQPLNPDLWVTPDEILAGVQRADALFDQLRRELLAYS